MTRSLTFSCLVGALLFSWASCSSSGPPSPPSPSNCTYAISGGPYAGVYPCHEPVGVYTPSLGVTGITMIENFLPGVNCQPVSLCSYGWDMDLVGAPRVGGYASLNTGIFDFFVNDSVPVGGVPNGDQCRGGKVTTGTTYSLDLTSFAIDGGSAVETYYALHGVATASLNCRLSGAISVVVTF